MIRFKLLISLLSLAAVSCSEKSNYSARPAPKVEKPKTNVQSENVTTVAQPVATSSPPPQTPPVVQSTPKVPAYGQCQNPCSGDEKVFLNSKYNKWVKVVLCSPSRYDILMSDAQTGPFYKVGDTGGHGQDHCELVNNSFSTLASDDDVKSGNCPNCNVAGAGSVTNLPDLFGKNIYYRSKMGEQFTLEPATKWGIHTSCWYECGVNF